MKMILPTILAAMAVVALTAQPPADTSPADLLVLNGRVYTAGKSATFAQAVAVRGNTIAAVGSAKTIERLRGPGTQIVDAGGGVYRAPAASDAASAPGQTVLPVDGVTTKQDVIYGQVEGSALLADIAYPGAGDRRPAIISVHGGRWRAGNRTDASSIKVAQWAGFGFFAMSIDYRLVGGSPAPASYLDTLAAIRWVHAHAQEYKIDPERVYLIGQSAGGQLVSLVATLGDGPFKPSGGWDTARSDVRAAISVAGPYDLNTLSWGNLWTPVGEDAEAARKLASPIAHVTPAMKPILVIHSDDDRSVPIQQAVDFAEAVKKAGVQTRFTHYTDKGHMGITDDVIREARAFIAEVEKK